MKSNKSTNAGNGNRPISRLPSGYGSIRYLGSGRSRPYAVHPPAVKKENTYIRPDAICYVSNWFAGFAVLTAFHAGVYEEGMEEEIDRLLRKEQEIEAAGIVAEKILEDYRKFWKKRSRKKSERTVEEIYEELFEFKFVPHAPVKRSKSRRNGMNAAFELLSDIHGRTLDELSVGELQSIVNKIAGTESDAGDQKSGMSRSTVRNVVTLIKDLYKYAIPRELCVKQSGFYVVMPHTREPVHHDAFTDEELNILWDNKKDPVVRMILVMCYSGFRISAYAREDFTVNLEEGYFRGGVKTDAGKERVVPIHSLIRPFFDGEDALKLLGGKSTSQFRRDMKQKLKELGLRILTPHSCRHTFNRLLEKAGVGETDRKRLMGHSLKGDLLNETYGHRGLEELRTELEKVHR